MVYKIFSSLHTLNIDISIHIFQSNYSLYAYNYYYYYYYYYYSSHVGYMCSIYICIYRVVFFMSTSSLNKSYLISICGGERSSSRRTGTPGVQSTSIYIRGTVSTPLLRQSASCIHRKIHTKFCGLDVNAVYTMS